MSVESQVPDAGTQIFDKNGFINPVWHQFFFTLLRRTGGAEGVDSGSESGRITKVEKRIESAEQEIQEEVQVFRSSQQVFPEVIPLVQRKGIEEVQQVFPHGLQNDPDLHDIASAVANGFMSAADKSKLDGISPGAGVFTPTNLSIGTRTTTTVPVNSSTGSPASIPSATTLLAGLMASADKTKLDGIAASATNVTILGTVSQSGGVPTGSVIESGSNVNGEYVKFADGTMIQKLVIASQSIAVTTSYASSFYGPSTPLSWTFPVPFIGTAPSARLDAYAISHLSYGVLANSPSLTSVMFVVKDELSHTTNFSLTYTAFGRWF